MEPLPGSTMTDSLSGSRAHCPAQTLAAQIISVPNQLALACTLRSAHRMLAENSLLWLVREMVLLLEKITLDTVFGE